MLDSSANPAGATINTFKSFSPCNHCRFSCSSVRIGDLCCCTAEVSARIPSLNAIEGVQEGAEKSLAGQGTDGAMATLGTDLPLASDLGILRKPRIHSDAIGVCRYRSLSGEDPDTDRIWIRVSPCPSCGLAVNFVHRSLERS